MKKLTAVLLALVLVLALAPAAAADGPPRFSYELLLTDGSGLPVSNPRQMSAGDTLHAEIVLTRTDESGPYDMFGIEFRLMTLGLQYNNDGKTLRSGTVVREMHYSDGDSVGFAWYDLQQIGEQTNNPVLAGSWSYTVTDPAAVNITVPVALVYVTGHTTDNVPTGNASLLLDPNGGRILGKDVSGTYPSGTVVILPGAELGDAVFAGWSDGRTLYGAGSEYTVSGVVTLTAQWENLVRNRYLLLDPNGGEILGEDISGYYADGEIVTLPDAQRTGYRLLGWSDGKTLYSPGTEYTVTNTVTLTAWWEIDPEASEPGESGAICWLTGILTGLLGVFLLILLLWKRRYVKYSLVDGDIALRYRNKKRSVQVAVVLYDDEEKEYFLNKSPRIPVKERLRYIRNLTGRPIAPIEPGKYKGKLVVSDGSYVKIIKCRIKALDRELKRKPRK